MLIPNSARAARTAFLALAAAALAACASLNIHAQTFNERAAVAYSTVTYAREAAGTLLEAGTITAAEAENVQAQADNARAALDIARQVHATDPAAGDAKLAAILAGLNGLAEYLRGLQR